MRKILVLILFTQIIHFSSFSQVENENYFLPAPAKILSQYLQIASPTGSEKKAGIYFSDLCKKLGLHVKVFTSQADSYNFAASLYPLDPDLPNIVFLNHIDVVPASDTSANWKYPPFAGMVADSAVWGRGALDNKGVAIMQVFAVAEFVAAAKIKKLPYNVTILAVSAEETGGELGAKIISKRFLNLLNPVVVLGEGGAGVSGILPSNAQKKIFGVEISQKKLLWLKVVLAAKSSGHGAVPPKKYTNKAMVASLSKLLERKPKIRITPPTKIMLTELGKLTGGVKGFVLKNPRFFKPLLTGYIRKDPILHALFTNTVTVTHIENPPKSPNQISQKITTILDCRLLPGTDEEKFIRSLTRIFDNKTIEVEIISKTIAAPYSNPENLFFEKLEAAVKRVYPEAAVIPILFPASNDNNYFRVKGVPVFGLTPVFMNRELMASIHNFNERLPTQALHAGIAVYKEFLDSILIKKPAENRLNGIDN